MNEGSTQNETLTPEHSDEELRVSLSRCIADAEEALSSGALLAHKLDQGNVHRALLTARSKLRMELGEAAT